jgi:hypothetical protein
MNQATGHILKFLTSAACVRSFRDSADVLTVIQLFLNPAEHTLVYLLVLCYHGQSIYQGNVNHGFGFRHRLTTKWKTLDKYKHVSTLNALILVLTFKVLSITTKAVTAIVT